MKTPELLVAKRERIIVPSLAWEPAKAEDDALLRFLGFMPGIRGGARGFNQAGDVVTQTIDGRSLNELWAAYQEALALYNAQRDRLLGILVFPVTQVVEDVFQGGDTVDFEVASEFGVPRGIRAVPPTYYSLGYSFQWYDIGIRFTWMFLAESTAQQVDSLNNQILEADNRNQFTQVYKQTVHTAPHTHFLASGGASLVSGDLDDKYTHLAHHGYSWQEGSALVLLVNSAEMAVIPGFTVAGGDSYDFIQAASIPPWAWTPEDVAAAAGRPGSAPPSSWNGLVVQGRYGPWLVVEDDLIPAGYLVGFASGGSESAGNLVGIREHTNTSLRGLRLVKGQEPDYPLVDSYYQRGFGTGVRQRGAAVVTQVTAGSYTIPTGYTW